MCFMSTPKVETPAVVAPAAAVATQMQVEKTGEEENIAGRKAREKFANQDTVESMFLGARDESTATAGMGSGNTIKKTQQAVANRYKIGV